MHLTLGAAEPSSGPRGSFLPFSNWNDAGTTQLAKSWQKVNLDKGCSSLKNTIQNDIFYLYKELSDQDSSSPRGAAQMSNNGHSVA